jgi:uncharacterized protein
MKQPVRAADPRRLDVAGFARAGGMLAGRCALSELPRLAAGTQAVGDGASPSVAWQAQGLASAGTGVGGTEWALRLQVRTSVPLQCQRCLSVVEVPLEIDRHFRFARDEGEAARLDEQTDDDVLVLTRRLDLLGLVEDELILALPIVPRHEVCPQPLQPAATAAADETAAAASPPHPFAALATLRRTGSGS